MPLFGIQITYLCGKIVVMRQLNITQKNEKNNRQAEKKTSKTLLQHIECIIGLVENSGFSNEFLQKAKKSIGFVSKKLELTINQTILLSVFIEKSDDNQIYLSDLSKFIGCRNTKIISLMSDIDDLEKRRFVRCYRSDKKQSYRIPIDVVNAIAQNFIYKPESTKDLNSKGLFKHICRLFNEREDNEISYEILIEELCSLFEDNSSLAFCRQINEYKKICNDEDEQILLLLFCHRFVNLDDDYIGFYNFENIYDDTWVFNNVKHRLQSGQSELIKNNILENINNDGFGNSEYFKISTTAKEKLFVELDIKIQQAENKKDLILHNSIISKPLFYNKREQSQIQQLLSIFEIKKFLSIQEKLEKNGMRKGFACLFYGAPGTGKTETVYQIAHATGRDIMMVNIAEAKSMWYGESEKRIKKIFDTYRSHVKTCETAPILLFNESDAVIGKRHEHTERSVDQTSNAIQNILLQEMENLDGIMIATTNLTQNLDRAFERRFLFKIKFEKPSIDAKAKIWNAMMPALNEDDVLVLAKGYDFSGGQIENIVRKHTVDCILNGIAPTIEAVHCYCQSEFLYKDEQRKKIGFNQ